MSRGDFTFFQHRVDSIHHNSHRGRSHRFHRLADGGERGCVQCRGGDVIEADHRALFGHSHARLVQSADCAKGAQVVEGQQRREGTLLPNQLFGELMTRFETRHRIARLRQLHDQTRVELQPALLGTAADATPARRAIGQRFGAADECDFTVAERVQMFERHMAADLVVDDHRTDRLRLQFAADHGRWNAALFEIAQQVDIEKEPVGQDSQGFDAAVEQHFQIALETAAFVVHIGENGKIGGLVESVFNATENESTERIGHVKNHDSDRMAALAAQGARELVGPVPELLRRALNALFGDGRNVAGQWRIVEHDRNRGRREPAFLGHVPNGHHRILAPEPEAPPYRTTWGQPRVAVPQDQALSVFASLLELRAYTGGHYSRDPYQCQAHESHPGVLFCFCWREWRWR